MARRLICGYVISLLIVFCAIPGFAEDKLPVAAVVNGAPIYVAELEQEVNTVLPMNQSFHGALPPERVQKLRSEALIRLVENELQYQYARSKGIQIGASELEATMKRHTSRFRNKSALKAAIVEAGFTQEMFEHFVERPLLAALAIKSAVDSKVSISDDVIKAYYDKNIARYSKPKEFRASHILFKLDPSFTPEQKTAVRKRADDIIKRLKDGADFSDIAAKESEDLSWIKGGDLGYFHAGQMLTEIEQALDALKVGEASGVLESLYGFHIVKLTELKPSRQIPFEEIRVKIKKDMTDAEKSRLKELWMAEIKAKAVITYTEKK